MPQILTRALYALLLVAFAVTSVGCDSGGDEDDEDDGQMAVMPSFNISSVGITCDSGVACLQFEATSTTPVALTSVVITNPRNQTETFNANDNVFLANTRILLQDDNVAYTRVSGNWSFRFSGETRDVAGTRFDVTQTLSVGALRPDPEIETEDR